MFAQRRAIGCFVVMWTAIYSAPLFPAPYFILCQNSYITDGTGIGCETPDIWVQLDMADSTDFKNFMSGDSYLGFPALVCSTSIEYNLDETIYCDDYDTYSELFQPGGPSITSGDYYGTADNFPVCDIPWTEQPTTAYLVCSSTLNQYTHEELCNVAEGDWTGTFCNLPGGTSSSSSSTGGGGDYNGPSAAQVHYYGESIIRAILGGFAALFALLTAAWFIYTLMGWINKLISGALD